MSLFKSILEIGSAFDYFSPIGSLVGDVLNGPSHTFLIPQECGYSGRDIERLLRKRGVDTWGAMVVQGTIMISTRQTQARYAQHLLDEAGIAMGAAPDETEEADLWWGDKEEAVEQWWPAFETLEELQKWWEAQ